RPSSSTPFPTRRSSDLANNDALMTLGIQPTFPNTGYGYIEFDKSSQNAIKPVNQFREKPDYNTAKSFIQQGNFLWNAGIFMWSVDRKSTRLNSSHVKIS